MPKYIRHVLHMLCVTCCTRNKRVKNPPGQATMWSYLSLDVPCLALPQHSLYSTSLLEKSLRLGNANFLQITGIKSMDKSHNVVKQSSNNQHIVLQGKPNRSIAYCLVLPRSKRTFWSFTPWFYQSTFQEIIAVEQ